MTHKNFTLKRLGVMNITPNSFSDGGELSSKEAFLARLETFGEIQGLDLGAESTAPMNSSISWQEEWERLHPYLTLALNQKNIISIDSYHSETIEKVVEHWPLDRPLVWNDVSGKRDHFVDAFLKRSKNFSYVLCHNLAPARELSGRHMDYIFQGTDEELLFHLRDFFAANVHPQIIFDPTLGFSKKYEHNWFILENFHRLQNLVPHDRWLLGFSRKSFLRKKRGTMKNEELDIFHQEILQELLPKFSGEVWIRTHRPELIVG